MNITKLNQVFISKYKAGHFLSPHSDKGNGRLAFVINITKNWLPQYGGNLHFLNNDRKIIIDSISPIFNSMILFEIPEPEGIPHFVSHVIPGIKISRYAISGWYE
jgi:Rps23 Pro-64 3,4-dihydroxylase Tpa1-like proline 4-hydroxylase